MSPEAKAHRAAARKREIRIAKAGNARAAIGPLSPGAEVYILTFGQFSLMDAVVEILRQTGPADVVISTWTAANADLARTAESVRNADIRTLRWIVDRSFLTRQPAYCAAMREMFGDESIRTTRSHAKFVTIQNDDWQIAIRTSMNLNENPRLENIEISDDAALCGFMRAVADELFEEAPAGDFGRGLPILEAINDSTTPRHPAMGKAAVGYASTGAKNG